MQVDTSLNGMLSGLGCVRVQTRKKRLYFMKRWAKGRAMRTCFCGPVTTEIRILCDSTVLTVRSKAGLRAWSNSQSWSRAALGPTMPSGKEEFARHKKGVMQ